ncbi:MAG: phage tail protein [Candidatus Entotheonellia bacterium]
MSTLDDGGIQPSLPRLRAETNPLGPAIDLIWELPDPAGEPDALPMRILRRERRFPGTSRRGVVPVVANVEDLADGSLVYDAATFHFDFEETREERNGQHHIATTRQYLYRGSPPDRILIRSIRREFPTAGGDASRTTVRVIDRQGLGPGTIYYYTAFVGANGRFSRQTQAAALATGPYSHALFSSLPQIHQRLDTIPPPPLSTSRLDQAKGQLQRFLEVFEAHADMLHGFIDGLRDLRNPRRIDSRLLPQLAQFIGWKLKDYLNEDGQRNEIGFAPAVYQTVGTIPSIVAVINRLTGWDAQVREFVRNILVSFEVSRLERLSSGELVYVDGSLVQHPTPPPHLLGRRLPPGSVNTTDAVAMFKLRTRAVDDYTAYSYDCGQSDGQGGYLRDDDDWYNRETIGIYIVPDVETEAFLLLQEWERIRQILAEFLPLQVRAVFVLQPAVVVEEAYDATGMVAEEFADRAILTQDEVSAEGLEESFDHIPDWQWLVANDLTHRTVDTVVPPVNTSSRTWHTGLTQGL